MKTEPVVADDWIFIDYETPEHERHLPLFIGRVLAATQNGRQFIAWFDHETYSWDLNNEHPLNKNDRIIAWTQVHHPKGM
jgi:hypothetical protein